MTGQTIAAVKKFRAVGDTVTQKKNKKLKQQQQHSSCKYQ